MTELPEKLSELLRLAVSDSLAVEAAGVRLDMGDWLVLRGDGRCAACMAGAVMFRTLESRPDQPGIVNEIAPSCFSGSVPKKLRAINKLRCGEVLTAARELGVQPDPGWDFISQVRSLYETTYNGQLDRCDWDTYMKIADLLESNGL